MAGSLSARDPRATPCGPSPYAAGRRRQMRQRVDGERDSRCRPAGSNRTGGSPMQANVMFVVWCGLPAEVEVGTRCGQLAGRCKARESAARAVASSTARGFTPSAPGSPQVLNHAPPPPEGESCNTARWAELASRSRPAPGRDDVRRMATRATTTGAAFAGQRAGSRGDRGCRLRRSRMRARA